MIELLRELCKLIVQKYTKDINGTGIDWLRKEYLGKMQAELYLVKTIVEYLYGETIEPTIFRRIMDINDPPQK